MKIRIQKIYAWSLVFEPMVFFILIPQGIFGIGSNISRLLALIVLMLLTISFLTGKRDLRFPSLSNYRFSYLTLYFFIAVTSGLIGILMGVYSFDLYGPQPSQSFIAAFLNSPYARPFFEYIILFYYIVYFVVFPSILLKNEEDIR